MIRHDKAVIGLILNNPENYHLVSNFIDTDDFEDLTGSMIWVEIKYLSEKKIPPNRAYISNSLSEHFGGSDNNQAIEHMEYIADCCKYFDGDILSHAKIVKREAKERKFRNALKSALINPNPVNYIINALEEYQRSDDDKSKTFKQIIEKVVDVIDSAYDGMTGLETGIPAIDRITGGLQPGKMYTIAARPGAGKTALTNQILLNVAGRMIAVGDMSLEMGDDELGFRAIATTCKANLTDLYKGEDIALTKMTSGIQHRKLPDWPVYFNTEQDELSEVLSQIRIWKLKYSIKLAVIDHVGLIQVKGAENRVRELSEATRAIKKLSKELDIPIIIACQINRGIDKSDREPVLSDLKGSGSIEEDSDVVIFLHEIINDAGYDHHKFIVAKNRSGRKGYAGQGFIFDGATQTFTEMGYEYGYED